MIKKILNENLIYLIIISILIVFFIILRNSTLFLKIEKFDYKVIDFFENIRDKRLTSAMTFLTNFGDWYIPVALIVCIFLCLRNKWYSYILAGTYIFAGSLAFITKYIILRPRPLSALIKIPVSYSFPSGHTLTSIVFYLTFFYLISKTNNSYIKFIYGLLFFILIIVIAFSRVFLGVHFFSDVIGGIILGIPCLLCSINIIEKNFKEKIS